MSDEAKFSRQAFRDIVWPELAPLVGGGALADLAIGDSAGRQIGIDNYVMLRSGVRSIAQRTQRMDDYEKPRTFTIREVRADGYETEWGKRLEALQRGFALPSLTVQAYVFQARKDLACLAVVHTEPFLRWCAANRHRTRQHTNSQDGNEFFSVKWTELAAAGVPLATTDGIVRTRAPKEFFMGWPEDRWI